MTERVIWERNVDHERIAHRTKQFQKRFAIVAAVIFVAVLIFGGPRNALGALIPLGILGAAWGTTVRFKNLSDKSNPVLKVNGGVLALGGLEVFLEDVKQFTTIATSVQTSLFGSRSRFDLGKAIFRTDEPGTRRDPQLTEFGWPGLDEAGVDSIREALETVLPGKYVEPVDLVAAKDLPRRTRRSRLG